MILALCGMMLGITGQLIGTEKLLSEFKPARDQRDYLISTLTLIAGTIFVTGIWGIGTYKIKHRIYVMLFGLFTNGITIAMGGLAAITSGLKGLETSTMESFCPGAANPVVEPLELFQDVGIFTTQMDKLNEQSSFLMCSPTCPCLRPSDEVIAGWTIEQNWLEIDEIVLNLQDRTTQAGGQRNQMKFYTAEEVATKNLKTFETFDACLNAIVDGTWIPFTSYVEQTKSIFSGPVESETKEEEPASKTTEIIKIKAVVNEGELESLNKYNYQEVKRADKYFSETYEVCSGYCKAPLFAMSQPISKGRIQNTCLAQLTEEFNSLFKLPNVISIITCGFAAFAMTAQYWLWKGYEDVVDGDTGKENAPSVDEENKPLNAGGENK